METTNNLPSTSIWQGKTFLFFDELIYGLTIEEYTAKHVEIKRIVGATNGSAV